MIGNVAKYGRKMVTIIDPHIKRDDGYTCYSENNLTKFRYRIHDAATALGHYVKVRGPPFFFLKNGMEIEKESLKFQ